MLCFYEKEKKINYILLNFNKKKKKKKSKTFYVRLL